MQGYKKSDYGNKYHRNSIKYINIHKKIFIVLVTVTFLSSIVYGLVDEAEIKKKAEKYASYDEAIVGMECFTYEGETYWMIDYSNPAQAKKYMVLNKEGEPVYNKETLESVALESIITNGFNESRVKNYLEISEAYQESARTINSLDKSLQREYESTETRDLLKDLGESYISLHEAFNKNAVSLNKSLTGFSPKNAREYMGCLNQSIHGREASIGRNRKAIEELNQIAANKTVDGLAGRSISFLLRSRVRGEILLSTLKQERRDMQGMSKNEVDEMLRRIKSKERESFTIPLLFLTIIIVVILVSILHLWR